MPKMAHPQFTSLSLRGEQFDLGDDGCFDLPEDLVAEAVALGCTDPPDPVVAERPIPQWSNDALLLKADELHLDVAGLNRPDLIKAVTAAVKAQA